MSEGLVAFDGLGRCTVCNRAAGRLLNVAPERAVGRYVTELLPDLDMASAAPAGRGPQLLEMAGRTLAVSRSAEREGVRGTTIVLRDVTDVLSVERLKRDVISTVSHELCTPLTAIQAAVDLLEGSGTASFTEIQRNLVALLSRNVQRMGRIVDDLLTMSALEGASVHLDRDRLDMGVLCARVAEDLRPVAAATGVSVQLEVSGTPIAFADEGRMRQVVDNLVQNAVKFSPAGSVVRIEATGTVEGARITITDEGPGIPSDDLERVFEKFYRAETVPKGAHGTGLGLPIARMITELHGGRLWLQSDGRRGTTAILDVPVGPAALAR
jgi:signal transduction histidine kinase